MTFKEVKDRVKAFKKEWAFGRARRVLKPLVEEASRALDKRKPIAWTSEEFPWLVQQLALCTYKDEELIPAKRFADALALLEPIGLRTPMTLPAHIHRNTIPETLGLAGAVYKRRWEHEGQLEHLHMALAFYRSAWDFDPVYDRGYGGANAAYILDLLASRAFVLAKRMGAEAKDAPMREAIRLRRRAAALRRVLLERLPKLADDWATAHLNADYRTYYWHLTTMGEVCFGLQRYGEAADWLAKARKAADTSDTAEGKWTIQSTFQQLLGIARAQEVEPPKEETPPETWPDAWKALRALVGESSSPAFSNYRGRVGLALSGGGFRASFFHIGVLARLADVDALRSIEVLSTVSGGSIVGAHYYLLLRQRLQNADTGELCRRDYVEIVEQLRSDFQRGVARNIRMRTLSNLAANLRMFLSNTYSRSARLGDLYERELYSLVSPGTRPGSLQMKDLRIAPKGADPDTFKPNFENWRRRAKIPSILLNATSLNSGHNWQFTARWMGEPPGLLQGEVDAVTRYRRLWYHQAPTPSLQQYPLGKAVAASSCVPGLFDPLVLEGLYPGRTVRLVDGGVHDNQGVAGLLNEGCTVILCSDASGQMDDVERPGNSPWSVPLRCSTVLQSRVRIAQYQDLKGRLDSRALQAFLFVHLKKDLEARPLDWTFCKPDDRLPTPDQFSATTSYGVDRELQRQLSAIRTDLDSFTEVEASALMASGYLMIEHELCELQTVHEKGGEKGTWGNFEVDAGRHPWPFLDPDFLGLMKARKEDDARRRELGRQLEVSKSVAFKVWRLVPILTGVAVTLGVAAFVALIVFVANYWEQPVEHLFKSSVGTITVAVLLLAATTAFPLLQWLDPAKAMRGYLNKAGIAVFGWVVSNLHLWLFDWLYQYTGRMKRLLELK